ncbi:LysR family transcriptional regulator [Mesobaculum littorinae]|nr:LysR family transcriptional regulator [Mesobaculum littorinae]
MSIDLRDARIVLACCREGSLGRAARALNLAQPAVTRALGKLEARLGAPLFDRTTRGVVPTIYGTALLPYAELLVTEAANAESLVRQMKGARRGVLRVGGVGSVVGTLLVAAITRMRRDHPDMRFQIVEELEDALLDSLKAGAIDLAISPEPYVDDEIALATPETFRDAVAVYARSGHPLQGARQDLAALAGADWALPPLTSPVGREWLRRFHAEGIEPRAPALTSRSVQVLKSAALAQDLLLWMPWPLMRDDAGQGRIAALDAPELAWPRAFRVYRRRKGMLPPGADHLLDAIRRQPEAVPL